MRARHAFLLAALPASVLACLSSWAARADDKPKMVDARARTTDAGASPVDDPMPACLAAGQKALDLQKQGKLLDARRQLALCAAPACGQYISPACQKQGADITAKLPSILFLPKDAEGSELVGVQVTIDGGDTRTLDGKPLTLDPGPHTFRFEALGLRPSERTFALVEGVQGRQEAVVVGVTETPPADATDATDAAAPAPAEATPAPAAEAPADADAPPDAGATLASALAQEVATERTSRLRPGESAPGEGNEVPGLVVGGIGVLGVAVGSVLGAMSYSSWSASQSDCSNTKCPANLRPRAVNEHDAAKTEAAGSTVAIAVGGVALVVGAYLFLNPPGHGDDHRSTARLSIEPSVSPAFAGLSLHGAFQ